MNHNDLLFCRFCYFLFLAISAFHLVIFYWNRRRLSVIQNEFRYIGSIVASTLIMCFYCGVFYYIVNA